MIRLITVLQANRYTNPDILQEGLGQRAFLQAAVCAHHDTAFFTSRALSSSGRLKPLAPAPITTHRPIP